MRSGSIYSARRGISPLAIVIYGILTCSLIPFLSIGYAIVIWFTPIIYANFLLTALFGVILGLAVYPIVRWGMVRSHKNEIGVMLLIWLAAMYFSWVAHLTLFHNMTGEVIGYTLNKTSFSWGTFIFLLFHPLQLLRDLTIISRYGLWSIGSIPFKDVALWFIWFLEAVIILLAMWKINGKWSVYPFSESENKWHKKRQLKKKLTIYRGFNSFIEGLRNDSLEIFFKAPIADPDEVQFTEIVIYTTPRDPISYLAFYNQVLKRDKNGKYLKEYKRSSDFYLITELQKNQLFKHFS